MTIEGDSFYCGDVCNHTGPHRYRSTPPPAASFWYACPHGLDMRIVPRCYLCRPLLEVEVPPPSSAREETP